MREFDYMRRFHKEGNKNMREFRVGRGNNNNNTFFIQGYSVSYNILAAINRSPVFKGYIRS